MITRKDVLEIKRLHTQDRCPYTHVAACYVVDNRITCIVPPKEMLNLPDEEFFKYLDIAKEIFQPKSIGEKNLELKESYEWMDTVTEWKNIATGKMMDQDVLESVWENIVNNLSVVGNYTILLYYGVYDIMSQTSDEKDLDESEEVYNFVTCAICPTTLEKPNLEMKETKIEKLDRKWIIGKPHEGFCYPAFENRSADARKALYYCADPKYPMHEIQENILGMERELTGAEYRENLESSMMGIVKSEEEVQRYLEDLAERLEIMVRDAEVDGKDTRITPPELESLLKPSTEHASAIAKEYERDCAGKYPKADLLYTKKQRDQWYARKQKEKSKELLTRASTALGRAGALDLAEEIEDYLYKTR